MSDIENNIKDIYTKVNKNSADIGKHDGDMRVIDNKLDNITNMLEKSQSTFATVEHCEMKEREMDELFKKNRDTEKKLEKHIEGHNNNNSSYIKYFVMAILGSVISLAITKL